MFYLFKNGECDTMCRSRKGLEKLIPKNTADEYVILEFDGFHTPYDLYIENGEIRVRRLPDMEPPDDVIAKQVRAKRDRLIDEEIAEKLSRCNTSTLLTVNQMLDLLLKQQEMNDLEKNL